jgi:hypothetical protein
LREGGGIFSEWVVKAEKTGCKIYSAARFAGVRKREWMGGLKSRMVREKRSGNFLSGVGKFF